MFPKFSTENGVCEFLIAVPFLATSPRPLLRTEREGHNLQSFWFFFFWQSYISTFKDLCAFKPPTVHETLSETFPALLSCITYSEKPRSCMAERCNIFLLIQKVLSKQPDWIYP